MRVAKCELHSLGRRASKALRRLGSRVQHSAFASRLAVLALLAAMAAGCAVQGVTPLERARMAREDQEFEKAAAFYDEFLQQSPDDPAAEEALFQLADIYYLKLKQYDRARDAYSAYLARYPAAPNTRDAKLRLAEVLAELGATHEAIAQFEELASDGGSDARKIRATIADLYYDSNDFSQAEIEYIRVIEGAEYDALSERSLLRVASINHMVRRNFEAAIPHYERIAASTGDPVVRRQALYSVSECLADLFRYDDAVATLRRIEDPAEAEYVAGRIAQIEEQKRLQQEAPPEVDWSEKK